MRFASNESEKQNLPVQNKVWSEDSLQTFASFFKESDGSNWPLPWVPKNFSKAKIFSKKRLLALIQLWNFSVFVASKINSEVWKYPIFESEVQICSFQTTAWHVYEGKWVLFKVVWCSVKVLPRPRLVDGSRSLLRFFKWGMMFKRHQNQL